MGLPERLGPIVVAREEADEVAEDAVAEVLEALELKGCGIACIVFRSVEPKDACIDSIPFAFLTKPSTNADLLSLPIFRIGNKLLIVKG